MRLNTKCLTCNLRQVNTVLDLMNAGQQQREDIMREVLKKLSEEDFSSPNPEIMGHSWEILAKHAGKRDIYREMKTELNGAVLSLADTVRAHITASEDSFQTAIKTAVAGNLIDFAAFSAFDKNELRKTILDAPKMRFVIDDSGKLESELKTEKRLLYIGDNCGEIVLDKLFIEEIKRRNPYLSVKYAVRGYAAINDVTQEDAAEAGMSDAAEVITTGDGTPGVVIEKTSEEFRAAFNAADVIIAKGQGNYESLYETKNRNIYYLFMAKCEVVASIAGVERMSIVCLNRR